MYEGMIAETIGFYGHNIVRRSFKRKPCFAVYHERNIFNGCPHAGHIYIRRGEEPAYGEPDGDTHIVSADIYAFGFHL